MHNTSLSFIDAHVEDNEAEVSFIQNFLNQKQMELSEMQKYLLQEFQDMEVWKDQRDNLVSIFTHEIKQLLQKMRNFCLSFKEEVKSILNLTLKETANGFTSILRTKESIIKNQQQQISLLRLQLSQQTGKVQNAFLETQRESTQRSILSRSIVLQNCIGRSKSRQSFLNSPIRNENLGQKKCPSNARKIMKEVQKNLKQDYENSKYGYRHGNDHKKYVKEKIELLKTRNSGIFYENSYKKL